MKKVLFINMGFYQYDERIACKIRECGYDVDMFNPRAPSNYFWKGFHKITTKIFNRRNYSHQIKFLDNCDKDTYEIIFVIVGRDLTEAFMTGIKEKNPSARFILYLWDEIIRVENFSICSKFYDKIYTFAPGDAANFGYEFLPLFYTSDFKGITEKENKVFFSGSDHSDRIEILNKLLPQIDNIDKDVHVLTSHSRIFKYTLNRIKPYIRFNKMSLEENSYRMERSRIVIDIQHPTQAGLTMRSIETLGARTKLITTNRKILDYDFYNPDNIFIVDRKNPVVPESFLQSPYQYLDVDIYEKYKLKYWVNRILRDV